MKRRSRRNDGTITETQLLSCEYSGKRVEGWVDLQRERSLGSPACLARLGRSTAAVVRVVQPPGTGDAQRRAHEGPHVDGVCRACRHSARGGAIAHRERLAAGVWLKTGQPRLVTRVQLRLPREWDLVDEVAHEIADGGVTCT
ncbi:MAG TPA: hypothetical protein VEB22_12415 [Phycisphaerales bacterium]|nr:hypothetical protein [Phycisphaerales bacterium]